MLFFYPFSNNAPNFVDGTVAGTNVLQYDDTDKDHDHTFFGNGCNTPMDEGGSTSSCTTRETVTYDWETQYIGVYYNFQAATSGFGGSGAYSTHPVSDDTFCPLGWQLPYAGTGGDYYNKSKSLEYLLNTYDIQTGSYPEGGTEEQRSHSRKMRSYPFSYIQAGIYRNGRLGDMTEGGKGRYWSIAAQDAAMAWRFYYFIGDGSMMIETNLKFWQFSVRCVFSSTARWQEHRRI